MDEVTLSVIIISHDQKDLVRRCIERVLQQRTTFPTEVIVSDDRSADGTREMLRDEFGDRVIATYCNTDDFHPLFTLERAGYNRLNGLKLARGKYLIHIDGDDLVTGTDLFQEMVDTLEAHPECTLCCQNYCMLDNDNLDAPRIPGNDSPLMARGGIYSAQEFFTKVHVLLNGCYCVRRGDNFNTENLWGGTYDDNYTTARYVGKGKVAVLTRCDFIYVQYRKSICTSMSDVEKKFLFRAPVGMAELAPAIAGAMLTRYTPHFSIVAKHVIQRKPIPEKVQEFCHRFRNYTFHHLGDKVSPGEWLRYLAIYLVAAGMTVTGLKPRFMRRLLYRLGMGPITPDVVI